MGAAKITSRMASVVTVLLGTEASLGLFRVRALSATSISVRPARAWVLAGHVIIGVRPAAADFHARLVLNEAAWYHGTSSAGLWIATVARALVVQAAIGSSLLRFSARGPIGVRHLNLGWQAVSSCWLVFMCS